MLAKVTEPGSPAWIPSAHTILVVDDDALITVTIASAIRHAGYRVFEATTPHRALELCMEQNFDLAILDQQMPEMSGADLARTLRNSHGVSSIFLSAYSNEELVEDAAAAGAISYLLKPVDPPNMLPVVRAALSRVLELKDLRDRESQLKIALDSKRVISVAIGVLMERLYITQQSAFDLLRKYARSQRTKIVVVADALLNSVDEANRLTDAMQSLSKSRPAGNPDPSEQ